MVVDEGELVKVYDMDKPAAERVIYDDTAGELVINGKSNPDDSVAGIYVRAYTAIGSGISRLLHVVVPGVRTCT